MSPFSGSKYQGVTFTELLVGLAVFSIVAVVAVTLGAQYLSHLKDSEASGEEVDLRNFVRRKVSCEETLFVNQAKCATGNPDDKSITLVTSECGKLSNLNTNVLGMGNYALRANCRKESDYFVFDVEYGKRNANGEVGKYKALFDVPLNCRGYVPPVEVSVPHWCMHRYYHSGGNISRKVECSVNFSLRDYYSGPINNLLITYRGWGPDPNGNQNWNSTWPGQAMNTYSLRQYNPAAPVPAPFSCGYTGGIRDFGLLAPQPFNLSKRATEDGKYQESTLIYNPAANHSITLKDAGDGWGKCRSLPANGCYACVSNIKVYLNFAKPPSCPQSLAL